MRIPCDVNNRHVLNFGINSIKFLQILKIELGEPKKRAEAEQTWDVGSSFALINKLNNKFKFLFVSCGLL